jgi:hypothetical protein
MPPMRAMAAEVVVDPACSMANWRTPEWLTENTANNPAGDRANRTSNHEARTCSGSGADHVGAGRRRERFDRDNNSNCKHKLAHWFIPLEGTKVRLLSAKNMTAPAFTPTYQPVQL